jgi:hypothetical protein
MARQRNFKAEYERRIAKGLARNLSRSQARGHPRMAEGYASIRGANVRRAKADARIGKALKAMLSGKSLAATARQHRISPERLSVYAKSQVGATYSGKQWTFSGSPDRIRVRIIAKGRHNIVTTWVREEAARLAGEHFNEAGRAIEDQTLFPAFGKKWSGVTITDVKGREYALATDPNEIYRALHANEVDWSRIYQRLTN